MFSFQNYNSKYCLGITGGDDNAAAIQWNCNKAPDQTWHRGNEDGTSGYYQIINGDGECLGVYQISTTEGALVVGWQCLGTTHPDQYWAWDESSTDPGYYYLVDYNSGQVVGVLDNSKALGASIVQWPNQHTPNNQLWEASSAEAAAPPVTTIANGNWAGYSAYPNSGDATGAWGNWVVPQITCTKAYPNARIAVWAGLWGGTTSIHNGTAWLPQIGTVSQCEDGTAYYRLIWEMETAVKGEGNGAQDRYAGYAVPSHCAGKIPGQAYYVCGTLPTGVIGGYGDVEVDPGDHVEALVYLDGSADQAPAERTFSITLDDFTGNNNGKYAEGTITTNGIKVPLGSISREGGVIAETSLPTSNGLADFGTLNIGPAAVEQDHGTGGYSFFKWVMYKDYKDPTPAGLLADPDNSLQHEFSGEEVDYSDTVTWIRYY